MNLHSELEPYIQTDFVIAQFLNFNIWYFGLDHFVVCAVWCIAESLAASLASTL